MTKLEKREFVGIAMDLDGKWFSHCRFTNCHLAYSGELETRFEGCKVDAGNVWEFKGPALHTVKLLMALGYTALSPQPPRHGPVRGITLDQMASAKPQPN